VKRWLVDTEETADGSEIRPYPGAAGGEAKTSTADGLEIRPYLGALPSFRIQDFCGLHSFVSKNWFAGLSASEMEVLEVEVM
jgi:hypothetical protein